MTPTDPSPAALILAIRLRDSAGAVSLVARGADLGRPLPTGEYPLVAAARIGDVALARAVLDRGPDLAAGGQGGAAIRIAARLRRVLQYQWDTGISGRDRGQALFDGCGRVIEALAAAGVPPADLGPPISADVAGPLCRAAQAGDEPAVRRMLDAGADVEATWVFEEERLQNGWQDSPYTHTEVLKPLAAAAEGGHVGLIDLLLDRGADVDGATCYVCDPLEEALQGKHTEAVRRLVARGAALRDKLACAARAAAFDALPVLVDAGAPLLEEATAVLCELMRHGAAGPVDYLMGRGIDVNRPYPLGPPPTAYRFPLVHAAREARPDLVRVILRHRPDLAVQGPPAMKEAAEAAARVASPGRSSSSYPDRPAEIVAILAAAGVPCVS